MLLSAAVTLGTYLYKGAPAVDTEVGNALMDVAAFWFPVCWSLALLIAFFFSVRLLFGYCIGGYRLTLLACDGEEEIERPGAFETARVWRKWFFVIIWTVAAQVIVFAALHRILVPEAGMMAWFSIGWLYAFMLLAALGTLPLMGARCNMVRVRRC